MDLLLKNVTPTDGVALKEIFHEKGTQPYFPLQFPRNAWLPILVMYLNMSSKLGVNMRYLGTVLKEVKKLLKGEAPAWLAVVMEREMVVRVAKALFAEFVKDAKPAHRAAVVAALLNALLGRPQVFLMNNYPQSYSLIIQTQTPPSASTLTLKFTLIPSHFELIAFPSQLRGCEDTFNA